MAGVNPFSDIRVIIGLIVTLLIAVGLTIGGQKVLSWREGALQNETKKETLKAASGIIEDGAKADKQRATVDQAVGEGRGQFIYDYQGAMRNEPETAARADRPVPDSVRKAFRARRLARERSGCAGEQCREGSASETPAER